MELKNFDLVDKTVLTTPKPTATSTAVKKNSKKPSTCSYGFDKLHGMNPSKSRNMSYVEEESRNSFSDVSDYLQEQRFLAKHSLSRASNRVDGIPSKYLKPSLVTPVRPMNISSDSSIDESDLLRIPTDTSTPRNSNTPNRSSLSESVDQLSYKLSSTNMSIDNVVAEFQKTMNIREMPRLDSVEFKPSEEAKSMLLADEIAWRKEHEMPAEDHTFSQVNNTGNMSVGEFFHLRSDTLSEIASAKSPKKNDRPISLVDNSCNSAVGKPGWNSKISNSLSITAIQKYLESEDTPKKATEMLFSHGKKSEASYYLADEKSKNSISLPVSKNSSYTSVQSENEAIIHILNKENIDILNSNKLALEKSESVSPSRSSSSRSSSRALTSLTEGKLPIESTTSELVWGCVRVDKCVTQDFSIRNKTSKRLGLKMSVSGYDFKIRKDSRTDSEPLSSAKVILHGYESKVFSISFIPTRIGSAVDELTFTPLDSKMQQTKKQLIRLFGYGGYDKIEFHHLTKDITEKFWMSLGKLDNQNETTKRFLVKNSGTLPSFVHINFSSKGFSQVNVHPNLFILIPKEEKEVSVSYVFSTDSYKVLQKSLSNSTICELGTLEVVSGSEVNRGRLRRLCRKVAETGITVDPLSNILKEKVQGEVMPTDLAKFRESKSSLKTILGFFNKHDIVITIERDPDQTILAQYPDESGMYQTLCVDNASSVLENTVIHCSCRLEPSVIFLSPPAKVKDSLYLTSEADRDLYYEIACQPEGLEIEPKQGKLSPHQELSIKLRYPNFFVNCPSYKVLVYVDGDVYESVINVK